MDILHFEDFPVGYKVPLGPKTFSREQVLSFAREFDPQPFHLDDEYAATTHFGRVAASGWHVCATAMRMMCDTYLLRSASLGAPGIEDLQWHAPVFPGDVVGGSMTVLQVRVSKRKPDMGLIRYRVELANQDERLVMSFQGWAMMRRRQILETELNG